MLCLPTGLCQENTPSTSASRASLQLCLTVTTQSITCAAHGGQAQPAQRHS